MFNQFFTIQIAFLFATLVLFKKIKLQNKSKSIVLAVYYILFSILLTQLDSLVYFEIIVITAEILKYTSIVIGLSGLSLLLSSSSTKIETSFESLLATPLLLILCLGSNNLVILVIGILLLRIINRENKDVGVIEFLKDLLIIIFLFSYYQIGNSFEFDSIFVENGEIANLALGSCLLFYLLKNNIFPKVNSGINTRNKLLMNIAIDYKLILVCSMIFNELVYERKVFFTNLIMIFFFIDIILKIIKENRSYYLYNIGAIFILIDDSYARFLPFLVSIFLLEKLIFQILKIKYLRSKAVIITIFFVLLAGMPVLKEGLLIIIESNLEIILYPIFFKFIHGILTYKDESNQVDYFGLVPVAAMLIFVNII